MRVCSRKSFDVQMCRCLNDVCPLHLHSMLSKCPATWLYILLQRPTLDYDTLSERTDRESIGADSGSAPSPHYSKCYPHSCMFHANATVLRANDIPVFTSIQCRAEFQEGLK